MDERELSTLLRSCTKGVVPSGAPIDELLARGLAAERPGKGHVLTPAGREAAAAATARAKVEAAEAKARAAAEAKAEKGRLAAAKREEKARAAAEAKAEKGRLAAAKREEKARLAVEARAAKPPKKPTPVARIDELAARLATLEAIVATLQARAPVEARAAAVLAPEVLVALLRRLDATHRLDGLVPLPLLRREAGAPRAAFDEVLLGLERRGVVQLKTTNDPSRQPDAADGLAQPGRGLLYFAVLR